MRALITGGKGFVGSHLKEYLQSLDFDVVVTDKDDLDVLDREKVFSFMCSNKFDHIYHLVGFSSPRLSFDKPQLCRDISINGTRNLLDAITGSGHQPKILIVSSAHVYGIPKYIPIDENHPLNPQSPYAESRIEQEKLALSYDLPIIISRSFNHTGPGQTEDFVCSSFAKQVVEIEKRLVLPVMNVGDLSSKRDFSDVRDIVRGYYLALEKGISGQIYNLCSGRSYEIQYVLDTLISFSNIKVHIEKDEKRVAPNDIPVLQGDNTKFCTLTGWKPLIPFDQTLKDIFDYWNELIQE